MLHVSNTGKCSFFDGKVCLMLRLFWLGTGTGNVILGSDRIPGSRHTAAFPGCQIHGKQK